jgi:uncharacterized membrane protein
MITTAPAIARRSVERTNRRDRISFMRLLWVAPLTVVLSVAVNFLVKFVVQALDPTLSHMGQLQTPLVSLTVQGAVAAIVVFAVVAAFVPRPVFWYRIIATVALLVSLIPDIALGMGGAASMWGMRLVGPFLSLGASPSAGGPPPSGAPSGGSMPGTSLEEVAVLVLLHMAAFLVCVVLLTTLTPTGKPGTASR